MTFRPLTPTPAHYVGAVQPIDVIEAHGLNYNRGAAVAYIARAGRKGAPVDELRDLVKAIDHTMREARRVADRLRAAGDPDVDALLAELVPRPASTVVPTPPLSDDVRRELLAHRRARAYALRRLAPHRPSANALLRPSAEWIPAATLIDVIAALDGAVALGPDDVPGLEP